MRLIDADTITLPKGFFEKVDNVQKFYDWLNKQPTIKQEKLTDDEKRIFLAAMGREENVIKSVKDEDSLVNICHEITRKVKASLWI